jgi:tetratricopeptide (TPR) repeat protein
VNRDRDGSRPGASAAEPALPAGGPARAAAVCVVLAALVVAVYARTAEFGFAYLDDGGYVVDNAPVREGLSPEGFRWAFTTFHVANWHPLTWLSHMADVELFGDGAAWMHRVNVAWHAASAILLFLLLRGATGALWRSALVAALFASHPLNVESVVWISERKNVLSTFLWFATLALYVRYARRPTRRGYAAVAGAFALGLLAKPMLVTLPLTLLLLDVWPLRRVRAGEPLLGAAVRLGAEKLPLLVLSVASSAITVLAQESTQALSTADALSLSTRVGHAAVAQVWYLQKALWPAGLCVFYPHPAWTPGGLDGGAVLLSAAVLALLTALSIWQYRARPWIAVGWGWYLVTLLPIVGLVQVGLQGTADRYAYVPLVGPLLALAWSLPDVGRSAGARRAAAALSAAALLLLAYAARAQVEHWRDDEALFARAAEVVPGNWLAWKNLGVLWFRQGRIAEAEGAFRTAVRARSWDADIWYDLATARAAQRDFSGAAAHLERAVALAPEDDALWMRLAESYAILGRAADLERVRMRLRTERPATARLLEERLRAPGPAPTTSR